MKLKFLFINAINKNRNVESFLPPLGLGYLISSLQKNFGNNLIKFKIIDSHFEQEIGKFKPNLIGITSVSQNYNLAKKYAAIAKKHKLPVIIGGVHITTMPNTLTKNMDVAAIGEGEETIVDLLKLFIKKGAFEKKELKKINGIAFWEKGRIVLTQPRKLIYPLDQIPMPARNYMTITNPISMFTSRGCPYHCSFCASSRFWNRVRFFSAEYVVREIKYLFTNYGINKIDFWDDLFVADRQRLKKIFILLKKERLLGKINFGCSIRSNLVDESLAQLLKKMGFEKVSMGLESASPRTLRYLKGETISIDNHINAIKTLRKYGIEPGASFIIGSPQETKKEILQTLNFIKKSGLKDFNVNVLTPFPGTPVWEYAKKRGFVGKNMDWSILDVNFAKNHRKAIILSEKLTRREIYHFFLRFMLEKKRRLISYAFKNPHKIPRYLKAELKGRLSNTFSTYFFQSHFGQLQKNHFSLAKHRRSRYEN